MGKAAIITDSNSGITQEQAKQMGIQVVPMPFFIDDVVYYEDIDLSQEEFYRRLGEDASVATSQPSPADLMDLWEKTLMQYDSIVHIPMSSGLSNSCETAMGLAKEFNGRVQVVDNKRISVTQKQSVRDAIALVNAGKSAAEVKEILEREALQSSIYVMVDTLKYLKKGGRITPAAAAVGTVLNLKPVLTIQGDKLDAFAKVRGTKAAFKTMCKRLEEELHTRFASLYHQGMMKAGIANTLMDEAKLEEFKAAMREHFPDLELFHLPLTMSIATHVGPGSLGIGLVRCCQEEIAGEI